MHRHIADFLYPWLDIEYDADNERHTSIFPPLLDMLAAAKFGHASDADGSSVGGSRAPLNLSAIGLTEMIERESRGIAASLGLPRHGELRDRLADIGNAIEHTYTSAGMRERVDHVATRAESWHRAARELLGIDARPYSPHVRCPNAECERWSTLRIRASERVAECVECGMYWSPMEFDPLVDWLTWSAIHLADVKHAPCSECADERVAIQARDAERRTRTGPPAA